MARQQLHHYQQPPPEGLSHQLQVTSSLSTTKAAINCTVAAIVEIIVALHDDVISKAFQGRNGRAFLFSHAMNIAVGPKEDRQLMTGLHTVADVYCSDCREVLGWKYERAY
ncbi:Protein yippee-like [Forsythia ovata]|uniref:Protein yippee-like n=1 Tax=Forsythia ovata TaxID=205694 RepID=A0ABD1WD34_9LAMI